MIPVQIYTDTTNETVKVKHEKKFHWLGRSNDPPGEHFPCERFTSPNLALTKRDQRHFCLINQQTVAMYILENLTGEWNQDRTECVRTKTVYLPPGMRMKSLLGNRGR